MLFSLLLLLSENGIIWEQMIEDETLETNLIYKYVAMLVLVWHDILPQRGIKY